MVDVRIVILLLSDECRKSVSHETLMEYCHLPDFAQMTAVPRHFLICAQYSSNGIKSSAARSRSSEAILDHASNSPAVIFFFMYRA